MKFGSRREQALRTVEPSIRKASASFLPPGRVDARGSDSTDYAQEMRIAAWRATRRTTAIKYLNATVWNRGRDLHRQSNNASFFHDEHTRDWEEEVINNLDVLVDVQTLWGQSPDIDQELVQMRMDGLCFDEIAARTGLSDWQVRQRYKSIIRTFEGVL